MTRHLAIAGLWICALPAALAADGVGCAGSEPGAFEGMLFHVEKSADYYVESNGVRSTTFKMDVVDLPTVDKLVMEYRFPAYTALEPRTVDPGGDIAAIKGTDVTLRITPTMATPGGRVILNEKESLPLAKQADVG